MIQQLIDEHAERIDALATEFESQVGSAVGAVIVSVVSSLIRGLDVENGTILQTSHNASIVRGLDQVFRSALEVSSYYPVVQAFISHFSIQVEEFGNMYDEMRKSVKGLPEMYLTSEDRSILANQAGAAMSVFDGKAMEVAYNLRQLSARSLGEIELDQLVQGASEVIRKMALVGPMGRDQLTVFFRMVGNLVYRNIEASGRLLKYRPVGPRDDRNRRFCAGVLDSGQLYTRDEIDEMDNGQVAGVFDNFGGHGCRHWWEIAA